MDLQEVSMWNVWNVECGMWTQQPFRIFKQMAAIAAGEASMESIFFGPTSGYPFLDPILRFWYTLNNIVIRLCFTFGPVVLILYIGIDARTFNEYAEGFYALTTLAVNSGISANIHFQRPLMLIMINNFEKLIRKRVEVDPDMDKHYTDACKFVEEWTLIILLAFIVFTLGCTMVPFFVVSYILYFATDRGEAAFTLPFPAWCPWRWRTPTRYFMFTAAEFAPIFYITLFCACDMAFQVGTCRLMYAFCDDVKYQLSSLDEYNKEKGDPAECVRRFCKLVNLHTVSKQFAPDLSEIFYYYYTLHFLWTLLTICITLLMLQTELLEPHPRASSLIRLVVLTFWSFAQIYVYCDSSERIDGEYEDIDVYSNTDWYIFPANVKRMMPLFVGTIQQPLGFLGFGGITCTRETFQKVANSGFSYFTVLRQFRT